MRQNGEAGPHEPLGRTMDFFEIELFSDLTDDPCQDTASKLSANTSCQVSPDALPVATVTSR
jgi:hypothetical protein